MSSVCVCVGVRVGRVRCTCRCGPAHSMYLLLHSIYYAFSLVCNICVCVRVSALLLFSTLSASLFSFHKYSSFVTDNSTNFRRMCECVFVCAFPWVTFTLGRKISLLFCGRLASSLAAYLFLVILSNGSRLKWQTITLSYRIHTILLQWTHKPRFFFYGHTHTPRFSSMDTQTQLVSAIACAWLETKPWTYV